MIEHAVTMKLLTLVILAGIAAVQGQSPQSCPTATRTIQNRGCNKECAFSDCSFTSTIRNPWYVSVSCSSKRGKGID